MAKRKTRKNKKTNTTVIGFVLLLALAVGVTVIVLSFITPKKKSDGKDETQNTTTVESTNPKKKIATETETEESEEEPADNGEKENQQTPAQYDKVEETTSSDTISATVTHSSIDNGKFVLRLTINELLGGKGSCQLYMVSGKAKYNNTAEIVSDPTSSTCAGFDVDIAKLSSGTWNYTVTITSGKRAGKVEGKITI